jgi:hypothetical protein
MKGYVTHFSFFYVYICLCNRTCLVYAHFSSCAVAGCCLSGRQIFWPRLVFTVFALVFIHSFSFSMRSHRATRAKELIILMSFHYDYIRLLCSLCLFLFFFSSSSQCSFTIAIKKRNQDGERTNAESYSVCSCLPTL